MNNSPPNTNRVMAVNHCSMATPSRSTETKETCTSPSLDTGDSCCFCLLANDYPTASSILLADMCKQLVNELLRAIKTMPSLRPFCQLHLHQPAAWSPRLLDTEGSTDPVKARSTAAGHQKTSEKGTLTNSSETEARAPYEEASQRATSSEHKVIRRENRTV